MKETEAKPSVNVTCENEKYLALVPRPHFEFLELFRRQTSSARSF